MPTEAAPPAQAVALLRDGVPVVDLWGGVADPQDGRRWASDTVVSFFSATKGVTAVCVSMLVQRGLLDPETPVADIWPEFAAAGKGAITVGQVCSHQAGLPYVERDCTLAEALAWTPMVEALAAQAPVWEPGSTHGYHMRTYGWLVGEIVRRVDPAGRTPGAFVRDEIAAPLGLDLWIGLPESVEPRVARLVVPRESLRDALAGREVADVDVVVGDVMVKDYSSFNADDDAADVAAFNFVL